MGMTDVMTSDDWVKEFCTSVYSLTFLYFSVMIAVGHTFGMNIVSCP